jgi:hypothetical protein
MRINIEELLRRHDEELAAAETEIDELEEYAAELAALEMEETEVYDV